MDQQTHDDNVKKIAQEIKGIGVAMITTIAKDGSLHSRPMVPQQTDFDGDLWFITGRSTVKVDEIESDNRVNVSFASTTDNRYVSIAGRAELRRDQKKIDELWSPALKAWFPKGKEDPDIVLLRVTPEVAQYWDISSRTLVQVVGFVKAVITGQRPDPGKNETLRF